MTTCRHCDQGIELRGKDHWLVQSIIPARIKIVRCAKLKDRVEWIIASSDPRVTEAGFKNRTAAQRAADWANAQAPEQRWHVEKTVVDTHSRPQRERPTEKFRGSSRATSGDEEW